MLRQSRVALFCLCALTAYCSGCAAPNSQPSRAPISDARQETQQVTPDELSTETDPTCCGASKSESLKDSWRAFVADGRYRLARPADMKVSNAPFVYIWGEMKYGKRPEDDHLAAIVVDTTRTDNARFSLIIFSPPEGQKNMYRRHWLYRDRDLSRTSVSRASGEMYVTSYSEEGVREACSVEWNSRQMRYVCD